MPSHPPPQPNYSQVRKAEQVRDAAEAAADQRRQAAKEKADRDAAARAKAAADKAGRQKR